MKKFLPLFIAAAVLSACWCHNLFCYSASALSETPGYGRVINDGVVFYKNPEAAEGDAVFVLTKSYYLYIIDVNTVGDCYNAEYQENGNGYMKLVGYVKKSDITLSTSADAPSPVYPVITAKIILSSKVYQKPEKTSSIYGSAMLDQTVKCYGSLYNADEESYYFCVKYSDKVGYILSDSLEVTLPGLHPDPMPTATPAPSQFEEETEKPLSSSDNGGIIGGTDNTLQIILIAAICIPAVIIVYLMFKPSKKMKHSYRKFYDDEDGQ